jgi:hypothetical protein
MSSAWWRCGRCCGHNVLVVLSSPVDCWWAVVVVASGSTALVAEESNGDEACASWGKMWACHADGRSEGMTMRQVCVTWMQALFGSWMWILLAVGFWFVHGLCMGRKWQVQPGVCNGS